METREPVSSNSPGIWWPNLVGGFLWPFATTVLNRWLPLHVAAAIAFTGVFGTVGLIYLRFPTPGWTVSRWFGGALLGGIACGILTYLLPWR